MRCPVKTGTKTKGRSSCCFHCGEKENLCVLKAIRSEHSTLHLRTILERNSCSNICHTKKHFLILCTSSQNFSFTPGLSFGPNIWFVIAVHNIICNGKICHSPVVSRYTVIDSEGWTLQAISSVNNQHKCQNLEDWLLAFWILDLCLSSCNIARKNIAWFCSIAKCHCIKHSKATMSHFSCGLALTIPEDHREQ